MGIRSHTLEATRQLTQHYCSNRIAEIHITYDFPIDIADINIIVTLLKTSINAFAYFKEETTN